MPFDYTVILGTGSDNDNLTLGPNPGNLYYIDIDANGDYLNQALFEYNSTGEFVFAYPLDSASLPLYGGVKTVKFDGAFFWTLEDIPGSLGIALRRWQLIGNYLEEQEYMEFRHDASFRYDSSAVSIEHYHNSIVGFYDPGDILINIGSNYGIVGNITYVSFGPSTSSGYEGKTEFIKVSSIVDDDSVVLNIPLSGAYEDGDPVNYYTKVWIFNQHYGPTVNNEGSLIINDLYDGSNYDSFPGRVYYGISGSTFYEGHVYFVKINNLFKIDAVTKVIESSMCLFNYENDRSTLIPIYDIDVDDDYVYKLQKKYSTVTAAGEINTYSWGSKYNIQKVVLAPYCYSIGFEKTQNVIPADEVSTIGLVAKLRDQYFVSVPFKQLDFTITGVPDGKMDPISDVTDLQGEVSSTYTSGYTNTVGCISAQVNDGGTNLKSYFNFLQQLGTSSVAVMRQLGGYSVSRIINQWSGLDSLTVVKQVSDYESTSFINQVRGPFEVSTIVQQKRAVSTGILKQTAGPKQSTLVLRERGGKESNTIVNEFIFVVEMYPAAYAIKIPITTYIFIRIRDYDTPLNSDTLYFEVEGVDVTDLCDVEYAAGVLSILYTPAEHFDYSQRVNVYLSISDADNNTFIYYYYFDCVPDWRKPYLANIHPANLETGVSTDTDISFDVYDIGEGVDIYSLILTVAGIIVTPSISVIAGGYHVSYIPTIEFAHYIKVTVSVEISDISPQKNSLLYVWSFNTVGSTAPVFTNFIPNMCSFEISNVSNFELDVFALEDGLEEASILMRINDKDVVFSLTPKLYRVL